MSVGRIRCCTPLGGSTIALAVLIGTVAGRANELADLRANQQLLSQRIDQLAQGQNPGTGYQFSANENPAVRAAVTGGNFPRSFLIPGTETSIKISGIVSEHLDYWMSGGNPNLSPQTSNVGNNGQVQAIPLHNTIGSARGNGIFSQTPAPSRFTIETRTPTAWGEARTAIEFDWAGSNTVAPGGTNPTSVSDNLVPRLKYAYGALGGFLAGQATSNFSDPDANAETVEFGGNVGEPGPIRVPQLRYTMPTWWGSSFSVSAETPETDIGTGAGLEGSSAGSTSTITTTCTITAPGTTTTCSSTLLGSGQLPTNIAKATAPELTAAYYSPQPWGHFDLSTVIRPGLDVTDGQFFAKHYVGFGHREWLLSALCSRRCASLRTTGLRSLNSHSLLRS
jgi:hypothetical protein